MRYKHLLLLLFVCTAITATCQEKFIEVIVSDTMWINPNQFVYVITANPSAQDVADTATLGMDAMSYEKRQHALSTNQKQVVDSFKKVLSKKGFTILPEPVTDGYNTATDRIILSFKVVTSTLDSLGMLYDMIKNRDNFYGGVGLLTNTHEDAYQQNLAKRIVDKARQKAQALANLGKMQLGNIIAIKEAPKEQEGWTAYPPLSALQDFSTSVVPGWHTTIYPRRYYSFDAAPNDQYQITNTLVVRFAVQ